MIEIVLSIDVVDKNTTFKILYSVIIVLSIIIYIYINNINFSY